VANADSQTRHSGFVPELSRRKPGADIEHQCTTASDNMTDFNKSLKEIALAQGQREDLTRGTAD
jgi:hypothetical protein